MSHIQAGSSPADLSLPLIPPLRPVDTPLTPSDTISQLIAFTSAWIDLASPDPVIAHLSRQVFNLEVAYAAFCGIANVVITGPRPDVLSQRSGGLAQFARAVSEAIGLGPYIQFHILVPMTEADHTNQDSEFEQMTAFAREEFIKSLEEDCKQVEDSFGTWDTWNVVRSVCKYSPKLSVALSLPRRLPEASIQYRWHSEPLRLLLLPAKSFLVNARGSFVLSKPHQIFIARCMRLRIPPWLLLCDVGPLPGLVDSDEIITATTGLLSPSEAADALTPKSSESSSPTPAEAAQLSKENGKTKRSKGDPTPHLSYIRYLQRNQPPKTMIERFGGGYQDYLQAPLQPLTDNLESITYEVFEKDPIKYEWYERAIAQALMDWKAEAKPTSSLTQSVVIAVVGAGRGPLVTRALRASQEAGVRVEVYAVEKNPNAYVLLQRRNAEMWQSAVTIIKTDMRSWKGPKRPDGTYGRVDIIVSELLGSFADNELSPECLDGVQHVLNPTHGISIPQSYSAHLTPISAPKIFTEISTRGDSNAFEMPYVVMLHAIDYLAINPVMRQPLSASHHSTSSKLDISSPVPFVQQAWSFEHPVPTAVIAQSNLRRGGSVGGGAGGATGGDGANEHNVRFSHTKFTILNRGVCHGIAGYFETVLYNGTNGKVELSTNPVTMEEKSADMISWFPIFFPLKVSYCLDAIIA
jgi:type II protein arginine methyltransferase